MDQLLYLQLGFVFGSEDCEGGCPQKITLLIFYGQFWPAAGKSGPIGPNWSKMILVVQVDWSKLEVQLVLKYHIGLLLIYSRRVVFYGAPCLPPCMIELGTLECSGWGKTQSWVFHWRRHSANCLWRRDHEVHSSQLSGLTNAIFQFEARGTHFVLLHDCFCYISMEPQFLL